MPTTTQPQQRKEEQMNPLTQLKIFKKIPILPLLIVLALVVLASPASATLPPGNAVQQWNQIAEDTVVGSGTFQPEGVVYMAYVTAAVYDAVVAIEGGFEPYGPPITAQPGASVDAAVVEAAYRTLWAYFPPESCPASPPNVREFCLGVRPRLAEFYAEALALIPDGPPKDDGRAVGLQAANNIIALRSGDGRMTPINVSSSFPTLPPGQGVWRLTPPFAAPQTPWVGQMRPFILQSLDQYLPDPPPSLESLEWVEAFNETKAYGALNGSARTDEQTLSRGSGRRTWSASTTASCARLPTCAASACSRLRGWQR
jgi:hypothetical protein